MQIDLTFTTLIDPYTFALLSIVLITIVSLATEAVMHIVTKILDYCQTCLNHLTLKKDGRKYLK